MSAYSVVDAIERLIDAKIHAAIASESCDPVYQQDINKASTDLERALYSMVRDLNGN